MLRLSTAAVCSAVFLSLASPAHASPSPDGQARTTTQELVEAAFSTPQLEEDEVFAGPVVLTSSKGVQVLEPAGEDSVEELLLAHGLAPQDFRTDENKPSAGAAYDLSKPIFLFQVEYSGATVQLPLPAPVVRKHTDDLLEGVTQVQSKGRAGLALKTTVKETTSAEDERVNAKAKAEPSAPAVDTLTVVRAPEPKIILIGTAPIPEPAATPPAIDAPPTQGVDAPTQTVATGDLKRLLELNRGNAVLLSALSKVGSPYVWGATGPNSFDCSGFVLWTFSQHGYGGIPRTSTAQGAYATPVSWANIQPGDLIWRPGHVAIYAGGGLAVHAANPNTDVAIAPLGWFTSNGFKVGRFPQR